MLLFENILLSDYLDLWGVEINNLTPNKNVKESILLKV